MRYYKIINDGYLTTIGKGGSEASSITITADEYAAIRDLIASRPTPARGYGYRLTASLTWEIYELTVASDTDEIGDTEALAIIMGGNI